MKRAICLLLLTAAPTFAAPVELSGSFRIRHEVLGGQARAGADSGVDALSLRTILTARVAPEPLGFTLELHDSRVFGLDTDDLPGTGDVNTLEPVQAFLSYVAGGVRVDAGRMMLNLGSRRLVAADDYRNTTNSYTGVRVDLGRSGARSATLFYTLPVRRRPGAVADIVDNRFAFDRESFDQRLWGGFAAQPKALGRAALEVAFVRFDERDAPGRPTRDRRLNNVNARLLAAPAAGRFDYEVEGIYQFGRTRTGLAAAAPQADVSAWFAHVDVGYLFPGPARARLSVEYDHASGDRRGGDFGRFDTLFGMRRPDFGPGALYAQVGRGNIMTPGLRLEVAPSARVDAFAGYRAMWLASRTDAFSTLGVRDAGGRSGRFAGHQVEARLRWWAVPEQVRMEVNGAVLVKGRFLEAAPNAVASGDGRYVSVTGFVTF